MVDFVGDCFAQPTGLLGRSRGFIRHAVELIPVEVELVLRVTCSLVDAHK